MLDIRQTVAEGINEVTDHHDHVTGKYRSSAHGDCDINLGLTKKNPCHNLSVYDSHLIMQEIGKFDMKIDVRPNGLEK